MSTRRQRPEQAIQRAVLDHLRLRGARRLAVEESANTSNDNRTTAPVHAAAAVRDLFRRQVKGQRQWQFPGGVGISYRGAPRS